MKAANQPSIEFAVQLLDAGRAVQVTGTVPEMAGILAPVSVKLSSPAGRPLTIRQIERYTAACKADLAKHLNPREPP